MRTEIPPRKIVMTDLSWGKPHETDVANCHDLTVRIRRESITC